MATNSKKYRLKLIEKMSIIKFNQLLELYKFSEDKIEFWSDYLQIIDENKNVLDNKLFKIEFLEMKEDKNTAIFKLIDQQQKEHKIKLSFQDVKRINNIAFSQNNKIKYLAFGDSISEGFTEEFGFALPGDNNTNKISGNSYSSYFANGLNILSPNIVEEYNNYSLGSSTIKDWIKILNNDFNFDKRNKMIDSKLENNENPFAKRVDNLFDKFTTNKHFIKKLKESNLITMTIGGNDLLSSNFIKKVLIEKITKAEFIEQVDIILKKTRIIFTDFLVNIRQLNNNAQIYILSYTNSIVRIKEILNQYIFIYEDKSIEENIIELTVEKINEMLSLAVVNANKILKRDDLFNIDFVDIYDKEKWEAEAFENNKMFFGFHPTNIGYQKIALNLLTKIIFNHYSNKFFETNFKNWSSGFISNNLSNIKNEFNIIDSNNQNDNDDDTIKKMVEKLNNDYYKNNYELSKKYEHLKNINFAIEICLSRVKDPFYKQQMLKFIEKWVFVKYKIFSIGSIKKFNNEFFDKIYQLLVKNPEIIKHLFQEFENFFTIQKINIITDKEFIDALYHILGDKNFVFQFIQMLLEIPNVISSNSLLIQVINDLIINIKNNDIIKKIIIKNIKVSLGNLINFIPEKIIEEFLDNIILAEENITYILEIFRIIITHNNEIMKSKNLNDMFRTILKLSLKDWILIFKNIYNKVQKNPFYNIYMKQKLFGSLYSIISKNYEDKNEQEIINNFEHKYIELLFSNFTYDSKLIVFLEKWFVKKEITYIDNDEFIKKMEELKNIENKDIENFIFLMQKMNPDEMMAFVNVVMSKLDLDSKLLNIFPILEKRQIDQELIQHSIKIYGDLFNHFIDHFSNIKNGLNENKIMEWNKFLFRIISVFEFFLFSTLKEKNNELILYKNIVNEKNKLVLNAIYSLDNTNKNDNVFNSHFSKNVKDEEELKKYLLNVLVEAKLI